MKQQLYLLRHAKAEPWSPLGNDFSRALSEKGSKHAHALARWSLEGLPLPDTVLCSPAIRTRETLAPILAQWPQLLSATDYVDSIYGASLDMLLTLTEDAFSYSERLLLVGHNPGLEMLLASVVQAQPATRTSKMATGTLAVIEFPDKFSSAGCSGILRHLVRGKNLSG